MKLALLGMGSVRCAPSIIASLANYFGERPLDLFFWDSDAERLDLFDRFARLCFQMTRARHRLVSTEDPLEALQEANAVVLAVGENCAAKYLKSRGSLLGHGETPAVLIQRCVSELLSQADLDARVLSLIDVPPDGHPWTGWTWPFEPSEAERRAVPHQILRFLNGDEYPHQFLESHSSTPVAEWLNQITLP